MTSPTKERPQKVALLETTIQVDRCKTAVRRRALDELLTGYDWWLATSITLLEFKATIIQECVTIHNQLATPWPIHPSP